MQFEDIKKESDKNEKSQLKFNSDGSINLPESVKDDLEKQKKEMKELDIWDDFDDEITDIGEKEYNLNDNVSGFNLYSQDSRLDPLKFSNNKTQEDVVAEVINLIQNGKKVIFIKGVCGTGKCLDRDTLIFCKPFREKYFGYYKISDLVGENGKILSLDEKGNIIESDFKSVRNSGIKKLYKLKTRTGRTITASNNHPFLTITNKGVEWVSLEKLNNSSYICIPNSIKLNNNLECDSNEIKVLAHLIAEGKLGDSAGSPVYFQDPILNYEIRKDYEDSLRKLFPSGEIKSYSKKDVVIIFNDKNTRFGTTNKLRLFIEKYGLNGKKSSQKFVPKILFSLNKEKISLFLNRLFSCDGTIYIKKGRPIIEYTTISSKLVKDVSVLLSMFGIQHTINSKKFRENRNYSWNIVISNRNNVMKYINEIGFIGKKQGIAKSVFTNLSQHKFSNIDKVPRVIREYLRNKGYSYLELDRYLNYDEIKKEKFKRNFKEIIKDKNINTPCVFKQSKIDFLRQHLSKVNNYIKDDKISFICNDNIMWDKIKSIEYLKEDETYDLEVSEHHNFIADGIIVHNSAIALNLAKKLGMASIIVPGKALQKQYMEDYSKQKYVLKDNHKKLKIKVITGRENHPCLYKMGCSADESDLPCKIELTEKNIDKLREYLKENPKVKDDLDLKEIRRISVAPVCPYWSPIIPSEMDYPLSAEKQEYMGLNNTKFKIYNRKSGCRYYNQFNSYLDSEVIVFNSMKYKLEMLMNRKPATNVEIIDECDEFLDSFANINRINLTRLMNTLTKLYIDDDRAEFVIKKLLDSLKRILSDDYTEELIIRKDITEIKKTEIYNLLKIFADYKEIFELVDDENYCLSVLETALEFNDLMDEAFVKFYHSERGLVVEVAATNLAKKFFEMLEKNKILILMSGTIHSPGVLRDIFGIKDFEVVDAEVMTQGKIEVKSTGLEIDCKYENFRNGNVTRESYLYALNKAVEQATKPVLVHVNSFNDLPSYDEKFKYGLSELISGQKLKDIQWEDKENQEIKKFKSGKTNILFTTKCNRGADFPGDQCRSIIFTKYPNPDVDSIFWKILNKTHKQYYWEFYKDKAKREFLQRVYRGIRSKDDWVYVLSPDKRVLDAVKIMNI